MYIHVELETERLNNLRNIIIVLSESFEFGPPATDPDIFLKMKLAENCHFFY